MATLKPRDGYWQLDWTDEAGRHRPSLGKIGVVSKRQAEHILKLKELELSTGNRWLGITRSLSFGEYAPDYLLWHRHEYPASHYRVEQIVRQHLLPRFEFQSLSQFETKSAEQYKRDRKAEGAKAHTIIKELRVLKAMLNRAVIEGIISENPLRHIKPPKILDSKPHLFYQPPDLKDLYTASTTLHAAIWKLYANTGMRRMEGLGLQRKRDIGSDAMRILSTEESRTKSGKWREIPLADGARDALDALPLHTYVLPRIRPESLSRACALDLEAAGLEGSLHTLRHTYISHLVLAGVPIRTVQLYAGHASITTTESYAYLSPGNAPKKVLSMRL